MYIGRRVVGELPRNNRAMTGGRREDDCYCTYLEEGSCLAHCYWDFLTAASLQTHREIGGGLRTAGAQQHNHLIKTLLITPSKDNHVARRKQRILQLVK